MEFSKDTIAALELPGGKGDAIYFDDGLPGFGIRLRSGGKRVWIVQYRAGGRQRRETLGDARRVDLNAARTAAKKRFAQVTLGGDPQAEKAEAKIQASLTVGMLADQYLALKEPEVRKNTFIADRRYLTAYWKPLRKLPIQSVKRRNVAAALADIISERGTTAAARARSSLSAFFSWAIKQGFVDLNPVIGTDDPGKRLKARERVLTDRELTAIWRACGEDDFGRIIRLLALTGARRDEIGGLQWSEVNLETGVLEIPGTRTKNHHPLVLTLPPLAISILMNTPRREGRSYVFGSRGGAFCAWSYSTLKFNARITEMEGAQIAPWHIHDIRRTVATGMAEIGVLPHIVEAVINHHSGHKAGVSGIYNRATYEIEKKTALAIWSDHVRLLVDGGERKVVPIRTRDAVAVA